MTAFTDSGTKKVDRFPTPEAWGTDSQCFHEVIGSVSDEDIDLMMHGRRRKAVGRMDLSHIILNVRITFPAHCGSHTSDMQPVPVTWRRELGSVLFERTTWSV